MFSGFVLRFAALVVALLSAGQVLAGSTGPAVSGPNGKISVEGGSYDDEGGGVALGSFAVPLTHSFGVQFDGAVGTIDDELLGGGGVHLFTRDPSSYLLGVYGSYHTWDSIDIWRTAAEAELYLGRFSLGGLAGYESVDVPTTSGGLLVLTPDDEHFFGKLNLSYYATENFKLSAGYRYESEISLGTASAEYLITGYETPVSVFARGDFGEDDYNSVSGGLKIYFGADPRKSLIQRHRTEDPDNYTPVFPKLTTQAPQSTTVPATPKPTCPLDTFADPNCICGSGNPRAGQPPAQLPEVVPPRYTCSLP